MKIKITGLDYGNNQLNIKGSTDGGEEVSKTIQINVKPQKIYYEYGLDPATQTNAEKGGIIPNPSSESAQSMYSDSSFFGKFKINQSGVLTIYDMVGEENLNGTYTVDRDSSNWRDTYFCINPREAMIKLTGNNGVKLILRYGESQVYSNARAQLMNWHIQVVNKMNLFPNAYDFDGNESVPFAGAHIALYSYPILDWIVGINRNDSLQRPFLPLSTQIYYTQEIRNSQGDDSWIILLNASEFSNSYVANPSKQVEILKPIFTEEQKAWGATNVGIYPGLSCIKIPDMTVIPKGTHRIAVGNDSSKIYYKIELHKEI